MHLMIDLETLDTRPTAAFAQLGWALFDPNGSGVQGSGCFFVDVKSCQHHGLTIDWETVQWWMRQDEKARELMQRKGEPVSKVLLDFATKVIQLDNLEGVWAHGASFDTPILHNAYAAIGMRAPWTHKICFDTRTLFMLKKPTWGNNTLKHSAEADAINQVVAVQSSYQQLYGTRI